MRRILFALLLIEDDRFYPISFRTEDVEGDDAGGLPSRNDTNFSADVVYSNGTNERGAGVITRTKVAYLISLQLVLTNKVHT